MKKKAQVSREREEHQQRRLQSWGKNASSSSYPNNNNNNDNYFGDPVALQINAPIFNNNNNNNNNNFAPPRFDLVSLVKASGVTLGEALGSQTLSDGKVDLSVRDLASLALSASRAIVRPRSFVVSEAKYVASAKKMHVAMTARLRVSADGEGREEAFVPLLRATEAALASSSLRVLQGEAATATTGREAAGDGGGAWVVSRDGWFGLLLCQGGGSWTFDVTLDLVLPYLTSRRTGCSLPVSASAIVNHLEFEVPGVVEINCDQLICEASEVLPDRKVTVVRGFFPPSEACVVQWMGVDAAAGADASSAAAGRSGAPTASAPVLVTCDSQHCFAVGDVVIGGTHSFTFTILNGSKSNFELRLRGDRTAVLGLTGPGVRRWDLEFESGGGGGGGGGGGVGGGSGGNVGIIEEEGGDHQHHHQQQEGGDRSRVRVLRVWLEYAVENTWTMTIRTEQSNPPGVRSLEASLCSLAAAEGISRETGNVAVCAPSSVEVEEVSAEGLMACDPSELPKACLDLSPTLPILLAYAFQRPAPSGPVITVTRHSDVAVLNTAIEEAHFRALVTPTGRTLYNLLLWIRNTSRQYARLEVQGSVSVWALTVDEEPQRPAISAVGHILIPLKKRAARSAFAVELVYEQEHAAAAMGDSGSVSVSFPKVLDLPIDHLFATLSLPMDYDYKDFVGDIKEVARFSKYPRARAARPPPAPGRRFELQAAGLSDNSDADEDEGLNHIEKGVTQLRSARSMKKSGGLFASKADRARGGVKALDLTIDTEGSTEFYFEQRLVISTPLALSTTFTAKKRFKHNKLFGGDGK